MLWSFQQEEIRMSSMTQMDRNQFSRYDLQDTRPRLARTSKNGTRILAGLTVLFAGVLAALTYAAIQVFDGWHHAIVIADIALILLAVAAWLASGRPATEFQADTAFVPQGMRPKG
jgi:hypothetical protein